MKLTTILAWGFLLLFLGACSFSSDPQQTASGEGREIKPIQLDPNLDDDGDMVLNGEELKRGRNPLVAELPELKIRFLQNFKVLTVDDQVLIDTQVGRDAPDFKYRVGELFLRSHAYKTAAMSGRFSTHSYGDIIERDISWINYPELDPRFFAQASLSDRKLLDANESFKISLENTVKLSEVGQFKSIKNLCLSFYYFNYETEVYDLLDTKCVDRLFQKGVQETFSVEIENVPARLLRDNFFKKGEFIISEVKDYEIPELGTTYSQLVKSVRAKSLPVLVSSPLETKLYYVSAEGKDLRFVDILNSLFPNKFKIEQNELVKVEEFENNLKDFTYLKELRDQDKSGRWYVFTDKLLKHYLDHTFLPTDFVAISYITGSELAKNVDDKVSQVNFGMTTGDSYTVYPLGNVSPNSEIEIQLSPKELTGTKRNYRADTFSSPGGSCGNNCTRPQFSCQMEVNLFEPNQGSFVFKRDYSDEVARVKLDINGEEFPLKKLIDELKVKVFWVGENLHISISDINKIKEINQSSENVLSLRLEGFTETTFDGIKLANWSGANWQYCIPMAVEAAGRNGWPLSDESREFAAWSQYVRWDQVKRGSAKTYSKGFSLKVSSVIENYFN